MRHVLRCYTCDCSSCKVAYQFQKKKNQTFFYHHTINTVIVPTLSGNYTTHSVLLTQELEKGSEDFPLCKDEVSLTVS